MAFSLVPNGHTLAVFTIAALRLVTIATLHMRALHKTGDQNRYLGTRISFE